MTKKVNNILQLLLNDEYYISYSGVRGKRQFYTMYSGKQDPVMRINENQFYNIKDLLKGSANKYTINKNIVRQLHGRCVLKKAYKQKNFPNKPPVAMRKRSINADPNQLVLIN